MIKQQYSKSVKQNLRNKLLNHRYISQIKFLIKILKKEIHVSLEKNSSFNLKTKYFNKIQSLLDKAQKKNILHKNTCARKKSSLYKLFYTLNHY